MLPFECHWKDLLVVPTLRWRGIQLKPCAGLSNEGRNWHTYTEESKNSYDHKLQLQDEKLPLSQRYQGAVQPRTILEALQS